MLYKRAYSRMPERDELQLAIRYVQADNGTSKTNSWYRLAHALLASNEFIFVD